MSVGRRRGQPMKAKIHADYDRWGDTVTLRYSVWFFAFNELFCKALGVRNPACIALVLYSPSTLSG